MSSEMEPSRGGRRKGEVADAGSRAEHALGPLLRDHLHAQGSTVEQLWLRLQNRGVKLALARLHQALRDERATPPYELLLEIADVLKVDPREFPALYTIRARLALSADDLDEADRNLKALRRARRLAEPDAAQAAVRAARTLPKGAAQRLPETRKRPRTG